MARLINRIPFSRRVVYRTIFLFGLLNGLVLLLNGRAYLPHTSAGPGESLFKYTAFFTHFLFFSLLLVFILYLLYALLRANWAAKILSVLLFSLAQFFVFVDIRVFSLYKFHLSGVILNAMTTPGYWDSVHFDARDKLLAFLAVAGLLLAEFLLFTLLYRRLSKGGWLWRSSRARWSLVLVGLVLLFSLGEKVGYGVCDLYNYMPVVRYEKFLPLYRPFTFKRMFKKYAGEEPEVKAELNRLTSDSRFNYPLPDFRTGPLPRRYNVIIILVESLRFDMLTDEIMPHLSSFARRATVCLNHYSAGNTSRFGGFGLFYGLYGTYWHQAINHRRGPVLIKQLINNDYLFKVISSTALTYPEFNQTLFIDLDIPLDDELPGEDSCERDEVLVETYLDWLQSVPPDRPFFSFLFLDSPHATYYFKDKFKKFEPVCENVSFIKTDLKEHRDEIFNRFRNAVHYVDHSLGRILRGLEEGGFLTNSIIVISGDHGEEFWENGYYGHNSAYTDYQTKVPLVLWVPEMEGPRLITKLTSHLDLPVTILAALGDTNDPRLYSLGYDILGPGGAEYLVLAGWDDCCLFTPELRMRFSTESYNLFGSEVIDREGRPVEDRDLIRAEKEKYLFPALQGMSRFLK